MADRVDDHRVLVDRSGTLQDITPLVGDLTATDDLETLAVEVGFTLLVNVALHFKLKKIDMTTSLKSIE